MNTTLVTTINIVFSSATIAGQIFLVLLLALFVFERKQLARNAVWRFLSRHAILFGFITALAATGGSLLYSEIIGYEPCKLCWFQRIFLYPQTVLFAVALLRKDKGVAPYAATLSIVGAIIVGYHYLLQIGITAGLPCSAVGYSAACSQRFVLQYGYITIPMMALTAFLLIIGFTAMQRYEKIEI